MEKVRLWCGGQPSDRGRLRNRRELPSKFQWVSRLGVVTAAKSLNGSQPNFARCNLADSWAGTLLYIFGGSCPLTEFCHVQNSLCVHLCTIAQLCRAISSQLIGKNVLSSNISSTCPHNMVHFGPLAAEIGPVVWGTPPNFNGFRVLAALLHDILVVGVSQTLRR